MKFRRQSKPQDASCGRCRQVCMCEAPGSRCRLPGVAPRPHGGSPASTVEDRQRILADSQNIPAVEHIAGKDGSAAVMMKQQRVGSILLFSPPTLRLSSSPFFKGGCRGEQPDKVVGIGCNMPHRSISRDQRHANQPVRFALIRSWDICRKVRNREEGEEEQVVVHIQARRNQSGGVKFQDYVHGERLPLQAADDDHHATSPKSSGGLRVESMRKPASRALPRGWLGEREGGKQIGSSGFGGWDFRTMPRRRSSLCTHNRQGHCFRPTKRPDTLDTTALSRAPPCRPWRRRGRGGREGCFRMRAGARR